MRTEIWVAIIGAVALLGTAVISGAFHLLAQSRKRDMDPNFYKQMNEAIINQLVDQTILMDKLRRLVDDDFCITDNPVEISPAGFALTALANAKTQEEADAVIAEFNEKIKYKSESNCTVINDDFDISALANAKTEAEIENIAAMFNQKIKHKIKSNEEVISQYLEEYQNVLNTFGLEHSLTKKFRSNMKLAYKATKRKLPFAWWLKRQMKKQPK